MTAALLAAGVALGGCGAASKDSASSFSGEQKKVAQAVEDLQSAGKSRDAGKICKKLLARSVVARLEAAKGAKHDCSNALGDSLDDADAFDLTVKSVKVDGTNATAVVESEAGKHDRTDTLSLVNEGGRWKLASIGS